MNYKYRIYVERQLVVYRVDGKPEREAVREMYTAFVSDPAYRPEYNGIADWRHVISNLSREDVAYIANLVLADQKLQQLWVGLVSQPMSTALASIYSRKVSEQHTVELCSTPGRASEILGYDVGPYLL